MYSSSTKTAWAGRNLLLSQTGTYLQSCFCNELVSLPRWHSQRSVLKPLANDVMRLPVIFLSCFFFFFLLWEPNASGCWHFLWYSMYYMYPYIFDISDSFWLITVLELVAELIELNDRTSCSMIGCCASSFCLLYQNTPKHHSCIFWPTFCL